MFAYFLLGLEADPPGLGGLPRGVLDRGHPAAAADRGKLALHINLWTLILT